MKPGVDEQTLESATLLGSEDPLPVSIARPKGRSPFLVTCDHAGRLVPGRLRNLGLPDAELERHIAWDVGALGVSNVLSEELDATLVWQRYSRLVIDCNRPLEADTSIPMWSDGTEIPGNSSLSSDATRMRVDEIFRPYHAAILSTLESRAAVGRKTILIAMHSFTPELRSRPARRPWQIGVLFNRDHRFGMALVGALRKEGDIEVGVNEPYTVTDAHDYAIPVYGEKRGLLHACIEIRQDLIATPEQQASWAWRLSHPLRHAAELISL
jgi:predicted N-formylglutamate amidohydrolase